MTFIKTKDKQYKEKISDKYHKMKQNDSVAFIKLFNISSVALIGQKINVTLFFILDRRKTEIDSRKIRKTQLDFPQYNHSKLQGNSNQEISYLPEM